MKLSKIEEKNRLESAIQHITEVMGNMSDQTTTWNYLKEAVDDLKAVLNAVYKD